jgi:hypothetical protein
LKELGLPIKKRYGIRRNKIFILTFILPLLVVFNSYWKVKKAGGDLELIKLSPDRSVLNLF